MKRKAKIMEDESRRANIQIIGVPGKKNATICLIK
jgi:hypothetical protein